MSRIKLPTIVLCAVLLVGCSARQPSDAIEELPTPSAAKYKTETVKRGAFELSGQCGGAFYYPVTADVICDDENAVLKEQASVHIGDTVRKGDPLATLTFDVSRADLEERDFQYQRSLREMQQKKESYLEQIDGFAPKISAGGTEGAIAALEQQKLQLEYQQYVIQAEAALAQQKTALEEFRALFSDRVLTAPIDGVVSSVVALTPGRPVEKGTVVVSLYSPEPVYFKVSSPASSLLAMASYQLPVTITAGKWSSPGRIAATPNAVYDTLDNQNIYIQIFNTSELPSGTSPSVSGTLLRLDDVLTVKRSAIRNEGNLKFVYLLEDGVSQKRYVICGPENNESICILDGLSEGQNVILN